MVPGRRDADTPGDAGEPVEEPVGLSRSERRQQKKSPVMTLARSGIFDLEYYSAAAGEVFPDRRTAARHCVTVGMPAGLSPNPFLAVTFLPKRIQQAWARSNVVKVLDHLVNEKSWDKPFGPLFHPLLYVERVGRTDELLAAGPLAHFMTGAAPDTPMPVAVRSAADAPTYAAARRALIDHARLVDAQDRDLPGTELSFHEPGASPWRRGALRSRCRDPGDPW